MKIKFVGIIGFILTSFLVVSLYAQAKNQTYGKIPSFSLTTQAGKKMTLADLKGHPWVADFIYTQCTDECPLLSEKMKRLQSRFPEKLFFVSFSVDPAHDTPAVLSKYAKRYSAGPHWYFLTGNPKSIFALAKNGFHLPAVKNGSIILHTNHVVLVDGSGDIRGYYDSSSVAELERLSKDIKPLLRG